MIRLYGTSTREDIERKTFERLNPARDKPYRNPQSNLRKKIGSLITGEEGFTLRDIKQSPIGESAKTEYASWKTPGAKRRLIKTAILTAYIYCTTL